MSLLEYFEFFCMCVGGWVVGGWLAKLTEKFMRGAK